MIINILQLFIFIPFRCIKNCLFEFVIEIFLSFRNLELKKIPETKNPTIQKKKNHHLNNKNKKIIAFLQKSQIIKYYTSNKKIMICKKIR